MKKHPASDMDIMELSVIDESEAHLFYSADAATDRINGCVGHLRGDFGKGTEFWTTWWPHQGDCLNIEPFKRDLDRVVSWLRQSCAPLKNLQSMASFCSLREDNAKVPKTSMPTYGFRIDTARYQYMLRCHPYRGEYNFYIYCYDKQSREREKTLPPKTKKTQPER